MIISIPREIMKSESRVAATPETVAKFVADGATVLFEKGAGDAALYSDDEYAKAGAELVADTEDLFRRADVIFKVKEPLFNSFLAQKTTVRIDTDGRQEFVMKRIVEIID